MFLFSHLPANLHYWSLKQQLQLYFEQTTSTVPTSYGPYKRLILSLISIFLATLVLLVFQPLPPLARLLLSDPAYFYHLPASLNGIFILFALDNLYIHAILYQRQTKALSLIKAVLYSTDSSRLNAFFCQPAIQKCGKSRTSFETVRKYLNYYLFGLKYFVFFAVALAGFYQASSLAGIAQYWRFFFTTFWGYLSLVLILPTALILDIFVLAYGSSHAIACMIFASFTTIAFIQLEQVNRLLRATSGPIHSQTIHRFTQLHTQMVVLVLDFNRFFGPMLFIFILCQLPSSTYILLNLTMQRFDQVTSIIFANFLWVQCQALVFFHVVAGLYCKKLHCCKKRLFSLAAANARQSWLTFSTVLRLEAYTGKFNAKKKYGMTYGAFGLMSSGSFFKFTLIFGELILYWLQLAQPQ